MKRLLFSLLCITLLLAVFFSGCASPITTGTTGPITVGSKMDTEGALLAQMIIQMLQKNGFQTIDKSRLGGTPIVRQALLSGEIDIYPEYTGNGAFFFNEQTSDVWKDAQQGYDRVKMLDQQNNNIIWLKTAPANNTWAIAITKSLSDKENLHSLSDFAAYVNRGGTVKLIGSEEFITSPGALPAFEQAYGFTLKSGQLLSVSSGDASVTERAVYQGTSGVNAAMAYGTDGTINAFNLVVLSDPKGVQPVYEPAPTIRGSVLQKYPEITTILDPVFITLTLTTLQTLNGQIAVKGQQPADVARQYLVSKGFLR